MESAQNSVWGQPEQVANPAPTSEADNAKEIVWSASEFIAHQKSSSWFFGLAGAGVLVLAVVYLITEDYFSVAVIGFVCLAIGIYANRKPNTITYKLSNQGVQVGEKFYSYGDFKAFSVIEEGAIACIWLRPLKRLMPTVAMYLDPQNEDKIIDTLLNYLPEEERQHDTIDRLSNRLRF